VYVVALKTIKVSEEIHEALRKLGEKGESFNDIIKRLLEKEDDQK